MYLRELLQNHLNKPQLIILNQGRLPLRILGPAIARGKSHRFAVLDVPKRRIHDSSQNSVGGRLARNDHQPTIPLELQIMQ